MKRQQHTDKVTTSDKTKLLFHDTSDQFTRKYLVITWISRHTAEVPKSMYSS